MQCHCTTCINPMYDFLPLCTTTLKLASLRQPSGSLRLLYGVCAKIPTAMLLHVLQSKQLGASNEGLTQELVLTDAELSELQQQISATRAQTLYIRSRGDQLSQEVSMRLRVSLPPKPTMPGGGWRKRGRRGRWRGSHALTEPRCGMLHWIM